MGQFCTFPTRTQGICSKWISGVGKSRCDKHEGLKEVIKAPVRKFRGDSKWGKENGLTSKYETN